MRSRWKTLKPVVVYLFQKSKVVSNILHHGITVYSTKLDALYGSLILRLTVTLLLELLWI